MRMRSGLIWQSRQSFHSPDRVIEIPARQRSISSEQVDDFHQEGVKLLAMLPGFLSFVVTLKAGGIFNLPHSDCAAVYAACRP